MFLSMSAATLHAIAYIIYMNQIFVGNSIPNPASWTIWAFLSGLNAVTFWKSTNDGLATAQFFTGSIACFVVWIFALSAGKFAPLGLMEWVVLASSCLACVVWYVTKEAIYANLIFGAILLISSIPTVMDVWCKTAVERALPWWLWTTAFVITAINVFRRTDKTQTRWWLLMIVPIIGIIVHGVIAIGAGR